jgi:hypothetical protein
VVHKGFAVNDTQERPNFISGRFFVVNMVDQGRVGFLFPNLNLYPDTRFYLILKVFGYRIGQQSRQGKRQNYICIPTIW